MLDFFLGFHFAIIFLTEFPGQIFFATLNIFVSVCAEEAQLREQGGGVLLRPRCHDQERHRRCRGC